MSSTSTGDRTPGGGVPTAAPDPHSLADELHELLLAHTSLLPRRSRVLVALSGGGDSMALLHLLADLRPRLGLELHAAHFDHGLRPASAQEARGVVSWTGAIGVECRVGRGDLVGGGQAAYREARYEFLRRAANRFGANRIALAHQRDDQIETLIFRLGRGSGVAGLAGIPLRRGPYVRPLLPFSRAELAAYVESRGIPHLADPANEDRRYARARIRHEVMPELRRAGGEGLEPRLLRLSGDARIIDAALESRARRAIGELDVSPLAEGDGAQIARSVAVGYDRSECARVLRILARRLGFELSRGGTRVGVEFIRRGRSGAAVELAAGLELSREFDRLLLRRPRTDVPADRNLTIESPARGHGSIRLGGRRYSVQWGPAPVRGEWAAELPIGELRFPLRLRGPRPGDRIRVAAGSRKLKKLWGESRVPRSSRRSVPVLVCADGQVCWVAGLATARFAGEDAGGERFVIGVSHD